MTLPVLKGERLTLRSPAATDLDRIVDLAGDFEVARFLELLPHPYSEADGIRWLEKTMAGNDRFPGTDEVVFAVCQDDRLIGTLAFRDLQSTPLIGYWLGRAYWGKGLMSEAVHTALTWLFSCCDTQVVQARVAEENLASRKVLAQVGFTPFDNETRQLKASGINMRHILMRLDHVALINPTIPDRQDRKKITK